MGLPHKSGADRQGLGHAAAIVTMILWSMTFVSSKVLLEDFSPTEILFFRVVLAYAALWLLYPRRCSFEGFKREGLYVLLALTGVTVYFEAENLALTYTLASNVVIVLSITPMLTALLASLLLRGEQREKLHWRFFAGFVVSILGVSLVSLNGQMVLKLNPLGDLLAAAAALLWALYTVLMRKAITPDTHPVLSTRKVFFYSLFTMLPLLFLDTKWEWTRFANVTNLGNLLFLGLIASAACFLVWNWVIGKIGSVKANAYLYVQPIGTIITSAIVLGERITPLAFVGIVLTLSGLLLSEYKRKPQTQAATEQTLPFTDVSELPEAVDL